MFVLDLHLLRNKKDVPEQLADPTPDIQLRDISFTAPPPNVQTPEIKRKKWDLHNESYLLLENLAIEPETPKQFNNIRTAPDGGEESESVFSKVRTERAIDYLLANYNAHSTVVTLQLHTLAPIRVCLKRL